MSNVLALPLVQITVETGNNEDWVDSIKYVVDPADGTTDVTTFPQLDLRGITFEMEIRRQASDHEVIFAASTDNGTIKIGVPPDFGFLIISVPSAEMQYHKAGDYVGDIVGHDDVNRRVTVRINLTIVEGITKAPVNKRIVVVAA
jgi:hypothetical protein